MSSSRSNICDKTVPNDELVECHDDSATEDIDASTQCHAQDTSTPSQLCTSVAKEDDTLVTCEFDCGPSHATQEHDQQRELTLAGTSRALLKALGGALEVPCGPLRSLEVP